MSKQILVQAQADHIESLFKASPLAAIEELVWNALDADAHEVRVDLITNPLGGVEAVRVSDDGTGIDILHADATFGSLGGSWKRGETKTAAGGRRLHGRQGRGRFKAFALGTTVEWRTTVDIGGERLSYTLRGEADRPGVFELDDAGAPGPAAGTEVYVAPARACCDSLLDAAETVQSLAAKFALYLKSYPGVRIYFNGLPVTPVIVQRAATGYVVRTESGAEAKLEVIEWKCKFAGSGRLVFTGADGFELYERASLVRSGGASFTAYLVAPRFAALAAENAFAMDELNPEVRGYIDAAKKVLKAHFDAKSGEAADDAVARWRVEGSYPFDEGADPVETARFDALALEVARKFDDFAGLGATERTVVFRLLRHAMAAVPRGGLKEFLK